MKFTDTVRNTKVELLDTTSCKISAINNDSQQTELIRRLLSAHIRHAPLDGGTPAQFKCEPNVREGFILVTGNMVDAANAFCDLDLISNQLRNDILEQIVIVIVSILPAERQELLIGKLQTIDTSQPPLGSSMFFGK